MPSTLKWAITYPAGSQAPNVPVSMQSTAESTDSAITTATTPTTGTLTFNTLYRAYGAGYATPGYRKLPSGLVFLEGLIGTTSATLTMTANTDYIVAYLPVEIRPTTRKLLPLQASGPMGWTGTMTLETNGDVKVTGPGFTNVAQASVFWSLEGISFWL